MKYLKGLFPKSDLEKTPARKPNGASVPETVELPPALMEELFPKRGAQVSAIFNQAPEAIPVVPAVPASTVTPPPPPSTEPRRTGSVRNPETLSIPDELRDAIFPKRKIMVSVVFDVKDSTPAAPAPEPDRPTANHPLAHHDFPIV